MFESDASEASKDIALQSRVIISHTFAKFHDIAELYLHVAFNKSLSN